ncbi:hypothetical protein M758_2G031100 [Ceratodon purpureus]|nr:hypothetical protein M758_2G031100 [Ceratodon purpureus]
MKSALPSQFWNEDVSSARSLDGVAHALPAQPPPLGLVTATRFSRSQQLLLLQRLLWIPCTPSYVVDADGDGGLVLDRVLGNTGGDNWWATLTGRVRAQRMFGRGNQIQSRNSSFNNSMLKNDVSVKLMSGEASSSSRFEKLKGSASRFFENSLNSSLYALCGRSRIQLGPRTALSCTSEFDTLSRQSLSDQQALGSLEKSRVPWRGSVALHHKLDQHQILLEATHHECLIDRESRYWDVPQTVSLDVASSGAREGLRYRLGVHHSAGAPMECMDDENARRVPLGALPGMRIQAGASTEKSVDLWKAELSRSLKKSYSFLEARPRISLSGALGGLLGARLDPLFGNNESQPLMDLEQGVNGSPPQAVGPRYSADLFASVGLNAQFGLFERRFCDFTKLRVRLDLGAVTALQSAISLKFKNPSSRGDPGDASNDFGHPTLATSFQQQVIGPLRARIDSRVSVDPWNLKQQPLVQEIIYALDYPLDVTGASKLCVWYSPTRREGMAEFRVLER